MVYICSCSHHHFKSRNDFVACSAISCGTKQPEINKKISYRIKLICYLTTQFIFIFYFLITINIIYLGANYIHRMNVCRQLSSMRQVCMICCQSHYYSVYVNISIIMVISAARCAANFKFYGNHLRVLLRFLSMNASCYTSKFYRVINRNN